MRPYKLTISAGEVAEISARGDYVRVKTSPVSITVQVPQTDESAVMDEGDDITLTPFDRLRISHGEAAAQVVTIYVGKGTRAGSSKVGGNIGVTNMPAFNGQVTTARYIVPNSNSLLLAAKASRRLLIVQNNDAAGDIYMTMDGATAVIGECIKVPAGGSLILDVYVPNGEIRVIGSIAINGNVVVAEG